MITCTKIVEINMYLMETHPDRETACPWYGRHEKTLGPSEWTLQIDRFKSMKPTAGPDLSARQARRGRLGNIVGISFSQDQAHQGVATMQSATQEIVQGTGDESWFAE